MANWPESLYHNPIEFRAPPPSPVASGRRSSVANDAFLTEFLHHSLRVPDLILPNHISPRQNSNLQKLPKLDFKLVKSLNSIEGTVLDEIARIGCFELVNHGISDLIVRSVYNYGAGIFNLSPEKKKHFTSRSGDRMYGFVDLHSEHETSEEFVWCRDDSLRSKLEAILPPQISNFSENIEILTSEIEKICGIILKILLKKSTSDDEGGENQSGGSVCYFHRQHQDEDLNAIGKENLDANWFRYEMIRMLIRGSEHSHTLCLHVCNGSEFHVYSKKGWVAFCPEKDAFVITIGDQLQRWSEGKYKHVMGRPISKGGDEYISMAFMYNPPPPPMAMKVKTISIGHQVLFLILLAFFCKFYFN